MAKRRLGSFSSRRTAAFQLDDETHRALLEVLRAKSLEEEGVVLADEGKKADQIRAFVDDVVAKRSPFAWVVAEDPLAPVAWAHGIRGPLRASLLLRGNAALPCEVRALQEVITEETLRVCLEEQLLGLSRGGNDTGVAFDATALRQTAEHALREALLATSACTDAGLYLQQASGLWDRAMGALWHYRVHGQGYVATSYRGRYDHCFHALLTRPPGSFFVVPELAPEGTLEQQLLAAEVLSHLRRHGWSALSGCGGAGKSYLLGQISAALASQETSSEDLRGRTLCPLCDAVLFRERCPCGFKKPPGETRAIQVAFCAPTNRAVAVLQGVLTQEAQLCCTLHALSCKRLTEPLDLLVIDEASMLSSEHCDILVRCKALQRAALLFVGDHLQLPPVGAGEVFRPLLQKAKLPALTRNMRASEELADAVAAIRAGLAARASPFGARAETQLECFEAIYEQQAQAPQGSCQVLALRNEERVKFCCFCIRKQHELPQDDYSQNKPRPYGFEPFVGLPVRFNSNRFKPTACKGSLGVITDVAEDLRDAEATKAGGGGEDKRVLKLTVAVGGTSSTVVVRSSRAFLPHEVRPAYAITVHDSQGGEFDEVHVLLPPSERSPLCNLEMLYTASSRARKRLTLWSVDLPFQAYEASMAKVSKARATPLLAMLKK